MPTRAAPAMSINRPEAYRRIDEEELMGELVPMVGLKVLELGCGAAWTTRLLVERLGAEAVTATEVDRIQHEKNLGLTDLPRVVFRYGGAERIADPDGTYDLVAMLRSLHHVPVPLMDQALGEIHRVLKPGGRLYCSEPVYWGQFNDLMRLIEDERAVRECAFAALQGAVERGLFELEQEVFFESEGVYPDWPGFEARFVDVTHSERRIGPERRAEIRAAFEAHLGPSGARFLRPHRVDLLRRLA
jgi:SAM-dependent methyltransferase